MALVTIQRSPSPSVEIDQDQTDSSEEVTDGKSQMRKRPKTSKQKLRTILSSMRFLSKLRPGLSQSYFTVKGAALILPHTEVTKRSAQKSHGGEIQNHLQAMLHLLRPEDTIQIAVRLEDVNHFQRYMALVSTKGHQDTDEAVILGIDCSNTEAFIGLVLPIWMGLKIKLGGDGGFSLCTDEQCYLFKPVSVQAMWSAIQSFVKVQHIAEEMKFIPDGLSHTWVGYYRSLVDRREAARSGQWNVEGIEVFAPSSLSIKSQDAEERIKLTISQTLKEVMMTVDLDDATSIMLRKAVEEKMSLSLTEFKGYFDEEVMRILGQMDEPSEILEFLYLGSEWNASNMEELMEKGIGHILNVTKEIDNFFEGRFHYYNVRVCDEEKADLLRHWDKTYKFISKARSQNSKVLVHCKMGVSRSASTVMAFIMKDRRWSVDEAFQFVKGCRGCVHPNAGFMDQLHMYEAILTASNKRDIFRCKSDQNLLDEGTKEEEESSPGPFLGDDLFHMMSHSDWPSADGGVACEEEWSSSQHQDQGSEFDDLQMDAGLDTESRSVDSLHEAVPDLPSPTPENTRLIEHPVSGPESPLASSHSSNRIAQKGLPENLDMAHEAEVDLESSSDRATSLLEGVGFSQLQTSLASQCLKLKADSSWIRPDTELEENVGQPVSVNEPVPSADFCGSTQPSVCDLQVASHGIAMLPREDNINQGPQFVPAAVNVPEPLPYLSAPTVETSVITSFGFDSGTGGQTHAGHSLNAVPAVIVDSSDVIPTLASPPSLSSCSGDERASSNLRISTSNDQRTVGVSGLAAGGRLDKDVVMAAEISYTADFLDNREERRLLDQVSLQQPTSAMSSSHSCMELCPQGEGDVGSISLFEREKIPLVPGTVLRTRLEIEGRQRDVNQESMRPTSPVLRSTSLKQQRDIPRSRYTQSHRLSGSIMSSPFSGRSLDDLQSLGVMEMKPTTDFMRPSVVRVEGSNGVLCVDISCSAREPFLQSLYSTQPDTTSVCSPFEDQTSSLTAEETTTWTNKERHSNPEVITTEKTAEWTNKETHYNPDASGCWSHDVVHEGKFDPHTLALIREIGSALSTSPTPLQHEEADGDALGTNMVKYFVQKIEKQTKNLLPASKNVPVFSNTYRATTLDTEDLPGRFLAGEDVHLKGVPAGSQCVPVTPARPREITSQNTSTVSLEPATHLNGQEVFCGIAGPDNSSSCSDISRTNPDVHTGGHKLFQPLGCTLDSMHNRLPILPDIKTDVASTEIKPECSPSQPVECGSTEPSIVRHLVERFELSNPDSERVSSEADHENTNMLKDVHSGSLESPFCDVSHLHQSGLQLINSQASHLYQRSTEDSSGQTSKPQGDVKLTNSPLTPPLLSSSHNPFTLSFESVPIATSSQSGAFEQEQAVQISGPATDCFFTGVNPKLSGATVLLVDPPLGETSSDLEPQPFSCSISNTARSAGHVQQPAPRPDLPSQAVPPNKGEFAGVENVLMRQVSNVGRRIRRLHGQSHPLTKLSSQQLDRGPFYSSI